MANVLTMVQPPRSPEREANGAPKVPCNHDETSVSTTMVDGPDSCFGKDRLENPDYWTNYPLKCSKCVRLFLKGGSSKTCTKTYTRVTHNRPTRICQNALNHRQHKCVHCLCFDCHGSNLMAQGRPKRQRNQACVLQPGEVRMSDGTIVPSS